MKSVKLKFKLKCILNWTFLVNFTTFGFVFLLCTLDSTDNQVLAFSSSGNYSNPVQIFYRGDVDRIFSNSENRLSAPKKFNGKKRFYNSNKKSSSGRFFGSGLRLGNPDVHLTAPQLIESRGYKLEKHRIFTTDGYILEAHRIPAPGRPVVAAFHGMFQSSRDFLMNEDHRAFAYKIADAGYDLWLLNARGNAYSRMHQYLDVDTLDYWDYSVDEIIRYDLPASIDYILAVTGQKRLNWVGYSLGTAVFFGLMSTIPEYNDKINVFFSLGTTAYVGNAKSPVLRLITPLARIQDTVVTSLNHGEFLPQFLFPIMRTFLPLMCYPEASINRIGLCSSFLFLIAGFNPSQSNPRMMPVMLGGTPSSISVKMLSQWYGWINSGRFSHYDYGPQRNIEKYGSSYPPSYDLSRVTAKTVIMYAENDWLSVPRDVQKTVSELPNVVENYRVKSDTFNHLDFIYGKNADTFVYDPLLQILRAYT